MLLTFGMKWRRERHACSPSRVNTSAWNTFRGKHLPESRPLLASCCWRRRVPLFLFQMSWKCFQRRLCFACPVFRDGGGDWWIADKFRPLYRRITSEILWIVSFVHPHYIVVIRSYFSGRFVAKKHSAKWLRGHVWNYFAQWVVITVSLPSNRLVPCHRKFRSSIKRCFKKSSILQVK